MKLLSRKIVLKDFRSLAFYYKPGIAVKVPTITLQEGKFVAVYQGQVVDSDPDQLTLFFRVREHFGRRTILITQFLSIGLVHRDEDEIFMTTKYSHEFRPRPFCKKDA